MNKNVWIIFSLTVVVLNLYLALQLHKLKNNVFYDVELISKLGTIKFPIRKKLAIFLLVTSKSSCRYRISNFFWQKIKKIAKEEAIVQCIKLEGDDFKNSGYCDTVYIDKNNRLFSKFTVFLPAVVILNSRGKIIFVSSVPAERGYQKGLLLLINRIITDYLKIQKIKKEGNI